MIGSLVSRVGDLKGFSRTFGETTNRVMSEPMVGHRVSILYAATALLALRISPNVLRREDLNSISFTKTGEEPLKGTPDVSAQSDRLRKMSETGIFG